MRYKGEDFFAYHGEELRRLRRQMQIVFQDPVSSLNPRMTVGNIIGEPIEVHGIATRPREGRDGRQPAPARRARSQSTPPATRTNFPAASGSASASPARWRSQPDFIVCDEPVSALDVSIQSQILNLLEDLQNERNIAYLFIAHNLAVVEHFSDEVAVMYLGRIVEKASGRELYANPKHPYTIALLSAPCPSPTRARTQAAHRAHAAKCRRPRIRRAAARSIRAAR